MGKSDDKLAILVVDGSSGCSVGLSINISEDARDHLASLLTRFLTEDGEID